jgi:hypothetical protein
VDHAPADDPGAFGGPAIDFSPPAAEPVPAAPGGEPDALDAPARALSVVGDSPPPGHEDTPADRHEDPPDQHEDPPDQHEGIGLHPHEGTDHEQYEATGAEPDDDLAGNDPPDAGDLAV